MRPRLAAALVSIAALAAAGGIALAAVTPGSSQPSPSLEAVTPEPTPDGFDEIESAIDDLTEAVRDFAESQTASLPDTTTPAQPADPQATPAPPEPEDASAGPGCSTERETGPGVVRTTVRCEHRQVSPDGSSSSVSVSSSSSVSVSSGSESP